MTKRDRVVGDSFNQDMLQGDLRCKIIYYSCINPATIAEINEAWGYSSPTYLYQNQSLENLKEADLISVDKQGGKNLLTANYDALFTDDNLRRSRDHINQTILQEYLIHSKGVHPKGDEEDRARFLQMGRDNLEQELEDELQRLEFDSQEFSKLTRLWKTDVFREVFLALDNTAVMLGERKEEIPANPLHYLFRLTTGLMESINRGREEQRLEIPPELRYRAEKIIVPAYRDLKDMDRSERLERFVQAMNDAYSMYRTKFREERFNYDFIENFIDLAIKEEQDKKFGNLLSKYRDGGIL